MKEWWYKIKNFFRNLYIYRKILTTDYQFDYGYLLDLEKFKLQLMLKSFKDVSHVDHTSNIRWISICIKLIDIIQEEDSALEVVKMEMSKPQFKLIKYVNINNASRFRIEYFDRYNTVNTQAKAGIAAKEEEIKAAQTEKEALEAICKKNESVLAKLTAILE